MKTRVITAVVGIAVLVLVMLTFNTLVFNLVVAAVALIFLIKKFLHTEEDDGAAAGKRPPETPAH